jgi:hypothetical protein
MIGAAAVALALLPAATTTDLVWVQKPPDQVTGTVYARVNGVAQPIANNAWRAWRTDGGREVVWASTEGAGGFENEGQSLHRYRFDDGRRLKLMAEYYIVSNLQEARSACRRRAFLVGMNDGGLGASHVAIVHPAHGQVYRLQFSRFGGTSQGVTTVLEYRPGEATNWENLAAAQPLRRHRLRLDEVLDRPLIVNPPEGPGAD